MAASAGNERQILCDWIDTIKARFHVEVADIAKRTAPPISPSTIYRWMDPNYAFNPSLTKIRMIARAFDVPLPRLQGIEALQGVTESDVVPLGEGEDYGGLVVSENQACWRITSRVLELVGYRPGDIVLVDTKVIPRADDIVCVQMYDFEASAAKTRFRVYHPPFVATATMDPKLHEPPILIDSKRAVIVGTVVRSVRVRPAA
jgi:hypothetical protein